MKEKVANPDRESESAPLFDIIPNDVIPNHSFCGEESFSSARNYQLITNFIKIVIKRRAR